MTKAITASTQEHLPVEDIVDDIVVLKDGSASLVIQTTAVNFGLLSEKEQDATIFAYAAMLNSLAFTIQILIRSKRTDITSYLEQLEESYRKQTNPDLKNQIGKYIEFVKSTVQKGKVLDKKFYLIIPFSFLELGAARVAAGLAKRNRGLPYPKEYIVEQARINLYPKKDHLIKQLTRLGLKGRVLTQPELVELFFDIYNPAAVGTQRITAEAGTYTGTIIKPGVDVPTGSVLKDQTSLQGETAGVMPQTTTKVIPTPQIQQNLQPGEIADIPQNTPAPGVAATVGKRAATIPTPPAEIPKQEAAELKRSSVPPPSGPLPIPTTDSEKMLSELQSVIDKAKAGLNVENQDPGQNIQPQNSEQVDKTQAQQNPPKTDFTTVGNSRRLSGTIDLSEENQDVKK